MRPDTLTKIPCSRLILIMDWQGVLKPILDIGAPEQCAADVYIYIGQANGGHDGLNVVCDIIKNDVAVVSTPLESRQYCGSRITSILCRLNVTDLRAGLRTRDREWRAWVV